MNRHEFQLTEISGRWQGAHQKIAKFTFNPRRLTSFELVNLPVNHAAHIAQQV